MFGAAVTHAITQVVNQQPNIWILIGGIIVAICAAFTLAGAIARGIWRGSHVGHEIRSLVGTETKPGAMEQIADLQTMQANTAEHVKAILAQVTPNGGAAMVDAVHRMEQKLDEGIKRLDALAGDGG